jgi:serine/threonine protein kinase
VDSAAGADIRYIVNAIATFLARSPDIDPHSSALNLGATLKPRPRPAPGASSGMPPSETLVRDSGTCVGARMTAVSGAPEPAGYDILGELGRGGMGVVYRARQHTLRREVAVKRLQSDDAFLRQAFVAESMVTGELEHPNIVPVYALCDEPDSGLWLVMKRIAGRTLAELLDEAPAPRDPRAIDRFIDVLLDVADALRFAHSRGVLHRDIKPMNVMVGSFGEVMLLDWGIAASFGDRGPEPEVIPHVRDLDMIAGTPLYMPPEMAEGRGHDCGPWTDVYLLGATLYEVISGRPPRRGNTLMDVLTGTRETSALPFADTVPSELQAICQRALAEDHSARYPDVDSFQKDLREYVENRQSRALSARAEDGLAHWRTMIANGIDDANRPRVYRTISEVISSFQHAALLWPDNAAARHGEAIARLAWANAALEGGDTGVAINAIEGVKEVAAAELRRRIVAVRQARRRTLVFARWLGAGLIGGQLLLIAGLAVFGWVELRGFTQAEILEELRRIAPAAAAALAMVDEVNRDRLDEVADGLGRDSELRVLLLEKDGGMIADSDSESTGGLASALSWPEVTAVRQGLAESWAEHPDPSGRSVLSLARPWRHVDGAEAVLALSLPRDTLDGPLHAVLVGGLTALLLSFLIWSFVVLRVSRRLAVSLGKF